MFMPYGRLRRACTSRLSILAVLAVFLIWLSLSVSSIYTPTKHYFTSLGDVVHSGQAAHRPEHPVTPQQISQRVHEVVFPVRDPEKKDSWLGENHRMLQALFKCLENKDCTPNQDKIVILGSYHFTMALEGSAGGEDIWARSTVAALRNLGYSYLYSSSNAHAVQVYQMFPDMVIAILMEEGEIKPCFADAWSCILSPQNPYGIPIWKILAFFFWTGPEHPLGRQWVLSPLEYALEGHPPNQFLGFSVEPLCRSRTFVPHSERNDEAYVFAKKLSYFEPGPDRAWSNEDYSAIVQQTGLKLVGGVKNDSIERVGKELGYLPDEFTNFGLLNQHQFLDAMTKTRVLIGVGGPVASPTPYDALCFGIPFINPILDWDRDDPQDRMKWGTQHGILKLHDPPYVYNVFKGDTEGLVNAVKNAIAHPIDSYLVESMTLTAIEGRLSALLERDWKAEATKVLAERMETGEGATFMI